MQNTVVCMPDTNTRLGASDFYYPVASSELIDSVTNLQPLVMSPFAHVPSLDQKELEELSNGDYFTGEAFPSPLKK